jgi:hypothetical protein
MKDNQDSKARKKGKLPQISIEFTSVLFSLMIFTIQDKDALMNLVPAFLSAPGDKERLALVESAIKKNLDQAINSICLLGLMERLIKQETSARATVSLVYFGYRIVFHQDNEELGKKESQNLWSQVWNFASQIPSVAREICENEENNSLRDWKLEVQDFTRRRWRTLRTEQIPRVKEEVEELQKGLAGFLNIDLS